MKLNTKSLNKVKIIIQALLSAIAIPYYFETSTGNMIGIVTFIVVFYWLSHEELNLTRRAKFIVWICSCIESFCLVIGKFGTSNVTILNHLNAYNHSTDKDATINIATANAYSTTQDQIVLMITFIGVWIICYHFTAWLYNRLDDTETKQVKQCVDKKLLLIVFVAIFVAWLPYFYINYPGVTIYDSDYQLSQVEGVRELDTFHPVIHTMTISLFYNIGKTIFGTSNAGVAVYSVAQMLIMALIEGYAVERIAAHAKHKIFPIAVFVYFAFSPLNAMYAITMWKDTLFAGFVLWFSITLFRIFVEKKENWQMWLSYIISASFVTLYRSNGIYAFIFCIPFLVFALRKGKKVRMVFALLPMLIYAIVVGPVYDALGAIDNTTGISAYSIPLQQIARVVVDYEYELTEEEIAAIEKIARIVDIKYSYNSRLADPVQIAVNANDGATYITENTKEFFALWIKLGLKYPQAYIKAEIDMTVGYWYPDEQYSTIYFGVYPNDFGITTAHLSNTELYSKFQSWCNLYQTIPLLGSLTVFTFFYNWYRKSYKTMLISLPVLAIWLTVMLSTPLFAEMRYMYSMMVCIPIILCTLISRENNLNQDLEE